MARQPPFAPPSTLSTTILRARDGSVIVQLSHTDSMIIYPDGRVEQQKISTAFETVDGSVWSVAMLFGKRPVYVGICEYCRHPRFSGLGREKATHGIVVLEHARTCETCGHLCCPRHYTQCDDDHWRCKSCARNHRIKQFIKSIFFSKYL